MKILCKLWSPNIGQSLKTQIITQTKIVDKVSWVLNSVTSGLINVYTKNEIWDISRDFSVDFENIFLS